MTQTTLPPPDVPSNGTAIPARPVDLSRPVLSGGGYYGVSAVTETLGRLRTDLECLYGDELYDRMSRDPIAGGSVKVLRSFTLASEMQLLPNKRPGAGQIVDDPKTQQEFDTSAQVADYCQWVTDKMDRPVDEVLSQFCDDGWGYGHKLADIVWTDHPRGDYGGDLPPSTGPRLQSIVGMDHKPNQSWRFVVDRIRKKVEGIVGQDTDGKQAIFPVDKFAIATWEPKNGDPRGSSIYEMAVSAWNYRVNTWPEMFKFVQRFGTPAPYGKLATDNGLDIYKKQDVLGGRSIAETFLHDILAWRNGQGFVMRAGDDVGLKEPSGDGGAMRTMLDMTRIEIVLAILFQSGATQESQFDSRAKSEVSMDVLGNILRYMKRWTCRLWEWQVLYKIVWFNWGKRFADTYTPVASLGDTDSRDTAGLLTALSRVGYRLTPSQLPQLDADAGVPIRQPGEESISVAGVVKTPDGETDKAAA